MLKLQNAYVKKPLKLERFAWIKHVSLHINVYGCHALKLLNVDGQPQTNYMQFWMPLLGMTYKAVKA